MVHGVGASDISTRLCPELNVVNIYEQGHTVCMANNLSLTRATTDVFPVG